MKTIIFYVSVSRNNTKKVAEAMSVGRDDVELFNILSNENIPNISDYDLVGFGSGAFYGKHHKKLLDFAKNLVSPKNQKAFIFMTSGMGELKYHKRLKDILERKGFNIVDEKNILAWDVWGPFMLVGGINKGRPNENDLREAKDFFRDVVGK